MFFHFDFFLTLVLEVDRVTLTVFEVVPISLAISAGV
jgi:hypothetical protein